MDRDPCYQMLEETWKSLSKWKTEELHNRVISQDEAIEAVATLYGGQGQGLRDPNRPLGSFLFLGPTESVKQSWQGACRIPFR